MPTNPNHPYVDVAHPRTVKGADFRYSCINTERGGVTKYLAHPWSANAGRLVVTQWLPMACGHDGRKIDSGCAGCKNR